MTNTQNFNSIVNIFFRRKQTKKTIHTHTTHSVYNIWFIASKIRTKQWKQTELNQKNKKFTVFFSGTAKEWSWKGVKEKVYSNNSNIEVCYWSNKTNEKKNSGAKTNSEQEITAQLRCTVHSVMFILFRKLEHQNHLTHTHTHIVSHSGACRRAHFHSCSSVNVHIVLFICDPNHLVC